MRCGRSLVFLNIPAIQQPEAYIGGADKLFDAKGTLTSESTRRSCRNISTHSRQWIEAMR